MGTTRKIKNCFIILKNKMVFGDLEITDNIISGIYEKPKKNTESIKYILPGFIDEHIHGSSGFDTMDASSEEIIKIKKELVKTGVTSFCPTTMTSSMLKIKQAIDCVRTAKLSNDGARIIGVNVEGPFISKEKKGAHNDKLILDFFPLDLTELNYDNIIKIMTVAPEHKEFNKFLTYSKEANFEISLGHSNTSYDDVNEALKLGARLFTHAYNAMSPLHHRDINMVGAMLLDSNSYAELIFDLVHVSVPAAKLLIKNKGIDKVILITDAMRAQLTNDNLSSLGGQTVYLYNNTATLQDGTLAGSILTIDQAVRNAVNYLDLDLVDIAKVSSLNAAKILHIDHLVGSIKKGKLADLVILDKDLNVIETIIDGQTAYKKEG